MADSTGKGYQTRSSAARASEARLEALGSSNDLGTSPPVTGEKRGHSNGKITHDRERGGSEAIDPDALSKALQEFEDAGQNREKTPTSSPSRKRQRVYGDR